MSLKQEPFVPYNTEKKVDSFTCRLNIEERKLLEESKKILEQPKDSTCFKTLAKIGYKCITSSENRFIIDTLFKNKRNNQRLGVSEFE